MPGSIINRVNPVNSLPAAGIVAALALLLYLPTLQFQFVNWDDQGYVTANEAFSDQWRQFLTWAFTTFQQGNWHPLTWISLKLDYLLWGLNPRGFHLTNVVLHAVNSFLVVVLMWRLFSQNAGDPYGHKRFAFAFTVGLIFAIHPLHVESVAWISERKDLLFAVFYLLSILAWIEWVRKPKGKGPSLYLASFLLCAFSLMSKPMAVSLPIVLLLLDIYPLKRLHLGFRVILEKIPFIAITLVSVTVTIIAQSSAEAVAPMVDLSLPDRLANAARAFFFYIYKGLVPVNLSPLYQLRVVDASLALQGIIAGTGILALFVSAIIGIRKAPVCLVLLSLFTVMLLPVLGIVQVGSQFAADRYMYLPILPLTIGVCLSLYRLGKKLALRPDWYFAAVLIAGLALGLITYQQMSHWRNSELLWKKVLAEDFEVPAAHYNLANYYLSIDRLDKAEPEWQATIGLNPNHSWAHNQLGNLRYLNGDLKAALVSYEKAVGADPGNFEALFNLAQVLERIGRRSEAREHYARFAELATTQFRQQIEIASDRIRQIEMTADSGQ